jgi:DNA-binding CsgD family transcriptional regulator
MNNERVIQDLADFINRVSRVERPDVIWNQLKDFASKLGMFYLAVFAIPRLTTKFATGILYIDASRQLVEALDREWPPPRNPLLKYTKTVLKPFTMSELKGDFLGGFDWQDFAPAGARGGDALVVPIANGELNAIALFAGQKPDLRPIARALVQVAAQFAFLRVIALEQSGEAKRRPAGALSERERACLRLAAMGKTDAQIGRALGITMRTVRFHFANAKSKLGASNRNEAVAMTASGQA